MISFLQGKIHNKNLRGVTLLVAGVGYRVQLALTDISRVGSVGEEIALFIHTHVREDAIDLFGFLEDESLFAFEQLINVNGIGPKLAVALLSGMSAKQLQSCITTGDHQTLTRIPGVGPKTAQRIVLELKDRFARMALKGGAAPSSSQILDDLRSAMVHLGYKTSQVEKAIKAIENMAKEEKSFETLLREALKHLS